MLLLKRKSTLFLNIFLRFFHSNFPLIRKQKIIRSLRQILDELRCILNICVSKKRLLCVD